VNPTCSNAFDPSGCNLNGFYNPASSSTSQSLNTAFSIQYGIGSVSGVYCTDNIAMGGRIPILPHMLIRYLHLHACRRDNSCAAVWGCLH
jgi:hypothetical protein